METTWKIRPGAVWHDGTAVTAEDLVFTATVMTDPALPIFGHIAYQSLDRVEAIDPSSVRARWKSPYINADAMFSYEFALPIPHHVLAPVYAEDKERFIEHPYFSTEFVGNGAFRVRDWERGSHLVFAANDRYFAGRPKLDEVRVKFIPDPSALAANILANEVDLTLGGRLSTEWAMNVRDQWREGKLEVSYRSMIQVFPQFIDPNPPIVSNLQFRRALVHALNRQEMMETLQFGLTAIGHTFISPREPEYRHVEPHIVKYDYDVRRAAQIFESLGFTTAQDGYYRDPSGQRFGFQIRTSLGDELQEKSMFATADDWQRFGIDVERHLVPPQRARDAEYRATFPAFDLKRQAGTMEYATSFHSSRVALPENNYLVSGNNSRYRSVELDASIDRYFTTIPYEARMQAAADVVRYVSENVAWIGLYYQTDPQLLANRLNNVHMPQASGGNLLFNVHEWDIR
jgi:peptide/nickel transport system substrate-binding protein